ncbi:MAG: LLM class flavin-dependent oxidoreductase, partial [Microbacterium sp.]
SWAWPKPPQGQVPVIIGAAAGPKTFAWIAENADGWMTTPTQADITDKIVDLKQAWADAGRDGAPEIHVLVVMRPTPEDMAAWEAAGVTELIWGLPDKSTDEVVAFIAKHGARLGLS